MARQSNHPANRLERRSEFRADFVAGRYDACLLALRGDSGLEESILAATALRRLGREADALALLAIVEEDVIATGDDLRCGRFCLERATSLANLDDPAAGRSFGLARAFFLRSGDADAAAALAELALHEARAAWNEGERTLALSTLERTDMDPSPETRAWARHLRGEIAASDLDFRTQLGLADETLRELSSRSESDVWLEAVTLQTLAHAAIELDERHVAKFVRARADRLAWTTATAAMHFDVLRYLAWYEDVRGNPAESRLLMTRAAAVVATPQQAATALVDEARLARLGGDARAGERLEAADAAVRAAAWDEAPFAALETVLELAQLFASVDAERSRSILARYRDLRQFSMSLARQQPTAVARERFWLGIAALERGERDAARGLLQAAFDFWCTVEFLPRAAMAAMALHRIGGVPGARDFLVANEKRWPGTFLQERMATILAAGPVRR